MPTENSVMHVKAVVQPTAQDAASVCDRYARQENEPQECMGFLCRCGMSHRV